MPPKYDPPIPNGDIPPNIPPPNGLMGCCGCIICCSSCAGRLFPPTPPGALVGLMSVECVTFPGKPENAADRTPGREPKSENMLDMNCPGETWLGACSPSAVTIPFKRETGIGTARDASVLETLLPPESPPTSADPPACVPVPLSPIEPCSNPPKESASPPP